MIINNRKLKTHESIFVIAETASSHEGRVDLAKELADAVAETNADAIKYQLLNAESLLVPDHHKFSSFKELQFSPVQWKEIIDYARSIGLFVIAEIFDDRSFELAEELDVAVHKIPTSDLTNPVLLKKAAATMKPLILSVGAASEKEIDFAVTECEKAGNKNLVLMHGFQSFPTKIEDTNFRLLNILKKYHYATGFADHIDAESELAIYFPLVATGFGAVVIEKHITLDRSLKGRDHYSALNPDEFARMVALIRSTESAYGKDSIGESEAEKKYRLLMKKKIVAARDIRQDELITEEDICFRRSDQDGLVPNEYGKLLKHAVKSIIKHQVIKESDVY